MSDAHVSRQMLRAIRDDDANAGRAFLQTRVAMLFKLMFWSLVALISFLAVLYESDPSNAPERRLEVYGISAVGLGAMAAIWRFWLVRPVPLSTSSLYQLDLVYSFGIGASFGASAYLQSDLRVSGYLSVVYATFTVFARALIVPSSGRRTAGASALTMGPMAAAALVLAFQAQHDVPASTFFVGFLLFCGMAIVLSTAGSHIIYGLNQAVTKAKQLGSYTLDRKIGEGGMGVVYLAHHELLRRPTAVKRVLPDKVGEEHLARFEREVRAMSRLTHPNSVAVYDYGRSRDGELYYAMEYLSGGIDLQRLVDGYGPQPNARVAHLLAQVCGALHEAHSNDLIHRDIKPANIILCARGGMADIVKVVDYGLVRELADDRGTSLQVVVGTPSYLSPEAITDPRAVGPASDLYAVGCVGYFLLTGKRPFTGNTAVEICIAHVTKSPPLPSQVTQRPIDPALETIVLRCLAKSPADRYANAKELRRALLAVSADDWSSAAATAWWTKRSAALPVQVDDATLTMPVNLENRGA